MCKIPFADAPEEPMLSHQVLTRKLFGLKARKWRLHGLNTENWDQSKSVSLANFRAPKEIKNFVLAHLRFAMFSRGQDLSGNGALAAGSHKKLAIVGRLSSQPVEERC
jgi:hypothetical protein